MDTLYFVTPTGFEPILSEPESEILSIELGGQNIYFAKQKYKKAISYTIILCKWNVYTKKDCS